MLPRTLSISLPPWLDRWSAPQSVGPVADRMGVVLELAARNVTERTGGPFAAAVFERDSGRLVSVGVNRVVTQGSSIAHAEVLALALADQVLGTYDLSWELPAMQLVSSSQMCAMCLGAVVWSGVAEVVWATTAADVVATVGFDEGPTPPDYAAQLAHRRIAVVPEVRRADGLAVLQRYVDEGGVVYNARH